jgi:uridine nucleosidase
LLIAF